jgi:hypothetical protein
MSVDPWTRETWTRAYVENRMDGEGDDIIRLATEAERMWQMRCPCASCDRAEVGRAEP